MDARTERLARVEQRIASGATVAGACAECGVAVPSFYRWRTAARSAVQRRDATGDNRDAILEAARQLFLREGFGVTMDRIATVAGVARQTVFNRYGSKERLFREVVQRVFARLVRSLLHVEAKPTLAGTLTAYARHYLQIALDREGIAFHRLAVAELRAFPDLGQLILTLGASQIVPVLAAHLQQQMDAGVIRACDPNLAAECFLASVIGHVRYRLLVSREVEPEHLLSARLDFSVELFVAGLTPRP